MYQWIRRWFGREKPDFVINQFTKSGMFRFVPKSGTESYPKKLSGLKRIAVLTTAVVGGRNGLHVNLRVYRSSKPEYLYLFVWSFGDNDVPDNILNSNHSSPKGYFAKDLVEVVRMLRQSGEAVRAVHGVCLGSKNKQKTAELVSK